MGKIRTVKPELYKHEELFDAEKKSGLPLRLAFTGLFTCCDREGRFKWQARSLKSDVLPHDDVDFVKVLNALCRAGFIQKYTHEGKLYGFIPSWRKHQSINQREPASSLPAPEEQALIDVDLENSQETALINNVKPELQPLHVHAHAKQVHASLEWKGMEGNGSGMELEVEVEVEMEQEREGNGREHIVALARQDTRKKNKPLELVFNHWKEIFNHPHAVLDEKRKRLIRQALKNGYSVDQLCEAITGCSYTPHNMGDNDRGQRYDGLHVILRDADQIDRFIHNARNPPKPPNAADKLLEANRRAAESWLLLKSGG